MRFFKRSEQALPDPALWERIESFDFDDAASGDGPSARGFADRLMERCRWRRKTAEEAILEYRRFVYLAAVAEHRAVPSIAVDLVWHQHLTETKSYWERFCGPVLGRPLHHRASAGGDAERERHMAEYAQTLKSYERIFAEAPPDRFWPRPEARFEKDNEPRLYSPRLERTLSKSAFATPFVMAIGSLLTAFVGGTWAFIGLFMMAAGGLGLLSALIGASVTVSYSTEVGVGADASGAGGDGGDGGCGGD